MEIRANIDLVLLALENGVDRALEAENFEYGYELLDQHYRLASKVILGGADPHSLM